MLAAYRQHAQTFADLPLRKRDPGTGYRAREAIVRGYALHKGFNDRCVGWR